MSDDPPRRSLADEALERRMRAEVRREMEEAEAQGRVLAARQASLIDLLAAAVQSGAPVRVVGGSTTFRGIARHAKSDLLSLDGRAARIECRIPALDEVAIETDSASRGTSIVREAESFAARMGLLELSGEAVEVVTTAGHRVAGVIGAVARDHVVVAGAGRSMIPLERIAFVIRHDA